MPSITIDKLQYKWFRILISTLYCMGGAFFYIPILIIYFVDTGLSSSQIGLLLAIRTITVILAEIPTGYIADYFGRKLSVIFGCYFYALSILVVAYYHQSFMIAAIGMILSGLAETLSSGAFNAMTFNHITKIYSDNKLFSNCLGHIELYYSVALAVFFTAGGYLYTINRTYPFLLSALFILMAGIILNLLIIHDRKKPTDPISNSPFKIPLKSMFISDRKALFYTISGNVLAGIYLSTYIQVFPLYLKFINVDVKYYGIIFTLCALTLGAGTWIVSKYHRIENVYKYLPLIVVVVFLLLGMHLKWYIVVGLFILFRALWGGYYMSYTLLTNYSINNGQYRATIESCGSAISSCIQCISYLFFGLLLKHFDVNILMGIIAIISLIIYALVYLLAEKKVQNIRQVNTAYCPSRSE